jgi:large subunit ribosomal protein L35Ae
MKAGKSQAPTVHIKKFFKDAKKQVAKAKDGSNKQGSRLYVKGVVAGFRRALTKQQNHTSLIKIQGVDDSNDVKFYLGKRIMYMYRTKTEKDGSRFRVMWGKVCAPHGTSGVVRAKFTKNLPPSSIGAPCRIMLFPSRV